MFVASGPGDVTRSNTPDGESPFWWGEKVDLQLCLGEYLLVESLSVGAATIYDGKDLLLIDKPDRNGNRFKVRAPASTTQRFAVALDAFRLRAVENEHLALAMRAEIAFFKSMKVLMRDELATSYRNPVEYIFGAYFHTYWGPDFHGYGSPMGPDKLAIVSQFASDYVAPYLDNGKLWKRLAKDGFGIQNYGGGVWYMFPTK